MVILLTLIKLAVGTPACFDLTKSFFKRLHWFGKRHKTDVFTRLGLLLSELHVPHGQCLTMTMTIYCFTSTEARLLMGPEGGGGGGSKE